MYWFTEKINLFMTNIFGLGGKARFKATLPPYQMNRVDYNSENKETNSVFILKSLTGF